MTPLAAGLAIFLGLHVLPTIPAVRFALIRRLGAGTYRGLFSLLASVGLGLAIYGMHAAPWVGVYAPPSWGRAMALWTMPVALSLMAAAYVPSWTRRWLRHPMLLSVLLWSGAHLLANGDLGSVLLFGGFGSFALWDLLSHNWRPGDAPRTAHAWGDGVALLGGAGSYVLGLYLHGLSGHPVW